MPTAKKTAGVDRGAQAPSVDATKLDPADFPVRDGEDPWTAEEVAELVADLEADHERQQQAIAQAEEELADLRNGFEGAGRDPADVGFSNFERDQEYLLANAARNMLEQNEMALKAIANGRYGFCENCEQPIGKGRLEAFPRASMCVTCKQRTERR